MKASKISKKDTLGMRIDKNKDSFKMVSELVVNSKHKISAEQFNRLGNEERIKVLRNMGKKIFAGLGNIRCFDAEHEDVHPSMGFCNDSSGWHCFACDRSCDIIDIIEVIYNCKNFKEAYSKAVEMLVTEGGDKVYRFNKGNVYNGSTGYKGKNGYNSGRWQKDSKQSKFPASYQKAIHNKYYIPLDKDILVDDLPLADWYLNNIRGLSVNFVKQFPVRVWEYDSAYYILFINDDGSVCRRWIYGAHNYHKENKWWNSKGELGIFNERVLDDGDVVFVCESAIDALTVMEYSVGKYKAVGLNGLNNFSKLSERKNMRIVLMLDNDTQGRAKAVEYKDKYYIPDYLLDGYSGDSCLYKVKDVNEAVSHEYFIRQSKLGREARLYMDVLPAELDRLYGEAIKFYNLKG